MDQPYKFVPVSAFFEAFQGTKAAQTTKDLLAAPYVERPEAPDPLVRALTEQIGPDTTDKPTTLD